MLVKIDKYNAVNEAVKNREGKNPIHVNKLHHLKQFLWKDQTKKLKVNRNQSCVAT